jgi:hypothetical protein
MEGPSFLRIKEMHGVRLAPVLSLKPINPTTRK